jgi:hypothetical protein
MSRVIGQQSGPEVGQDGEYPAVLGVQELLDPGDPVLQQVTGRTGTVGEQVTGVGRFHVLAEHQLTCPDGSPGGEGA